MYVKFNDGWAFGMNWNKSLSGVFPLTAVEKLEIETNPIIVVDDYANSSTGESSDTKNRSADEVTIVGKSPTLDSSLARIQPAKPVQAVKELRRVQIVDLK